MDLFFQGIQYSDLFVYFNGISALTEDTLRIYFPFGLLESAGVAVISSFLNALEGPADILPAGTSPAFGRFPGPLLSGACL